MPEVRGNMSHVDDGALHAYLDGELLPVERARLETHVAECPACRTRLEEERALVQRASGLLGLAQPPERAVPPLHQLRRARLAWRLRVPIAWAASVVLALGLGYYAGDASLGRVTPLVEARLQDSAAPAPNDSLAHQYRFAGRAPTRALARPRATPPAEQRTTNQVAAREEARADSAAAATRSVDNIAAASGVVAIEAKPALRPANPTPVPSAAVVTTDARAELGQRVGRLVTTEWPVIRAGPARELLGADPVGVPGLAVRNMRRSPTGEVVLVEQSIDSATVIQIFQERVEDDQSKLYRRGSAAPQSAAPPAAERVGFAGTERLARYIGGVRVEIAGPLSTDSLNRLLEQVKPIRP
jgi:anti-sigma factor RsiW